MSCFSVTMADTLQKADSLIDQIEETTISSYVKYIAFIALGLSVINFIVFCIVYRCIFRIFGRRAAHTLPPLLPAPVSNNLQRKVCGHCSKPVKNDRRKKLQVNSVVTRSDLEQRSNSKTFRDKTLQA